MKIKLALFAFLFTFVLFCSFLVVDSGLFNISSCRDDNKCIRLAGEMELVQADNIPESDDYDFTQLRASNAENKTLTLGSTDKESGYQFRLELSSKGAAIKNAVSSMYDNRDPKDPQPLILLSPIEKGPSDTVLSMANGSFELVDKKQRFPLNKLNWVVPDQQDKDLAVFQAVLTDANGKDSIKLVKTFSIKPDCSDIDCKLTIENLSLQPLKAAFQIQGPCGISREGARGDMRNIIAAYMTNKGTIESVKLDNSRMRKPAQYNNLEDLKLTHKDASAQFMWAAITNKYFAAILHAVPEDDDSLYRSDIIPGPAQYYDPGIAEKKPNGDENSTFTMQTGIISLEPVGIINSVKTYNFQLYLGTKDKSLFEKNPVYSKLGYFHSIKFLGCCLPKFIINPLAFGIMAIMKWMYGFIPNYGVVIIIFVVLVRLALHPVTKHSQVSMMRMQKLGPKAEAIKAKYANNKNEMNRQVMQLYRDEGVSPVSSMLPMFIQMPIWIALYSAIYANIELRGAAFLPFWITDLSAPDALVRFSEFTIPLLDIHIDSFNLLPLLLGTAMFLQQKLMPHSSGNSNPQVAQQQKMMMIMMPIMMLVFLYKAPSGLNMYIMASTFAGVAEQVVIRKHIREKEAEESVGLVPATSKTGGKTKKKKPKPFFKNSI
ncbi:MAG: YidC/Oxa1 family insertase periplasmic-domain containing protein [Sedimentisphaerales bacterium]|nr:YidC/Oxa1 family insertase periplasmic-domain containing protein [Sedimentisphaerales bacterium]